MSRRPTPAARPALYSVSLPSGLARDTRTVAEARTIARAYRRDGWAVRVRRLSDDTIVTF